MEPKDPPKDPKALPEPVRRRLRQIRDESPLTLKEIADKAGTSIGMIGFIERGKREASWDLLGRLVAAYGHEMRVEFVPKSAPTETLTLSRAMAAEVRSYLDAPKADRALVLKLLRAMPHMTEQTRQTIEAGADIALRSEGKAKKVG